MPRSAYQSAPASRRRSARSADTLSAVATKPSQKQRLVSAMIQLCARVGYHEISVAQVSATAGVSSATFYQQFESKEDCLIAAFRVARARVFRHIDQVAAGSDWSTAARQSLDGLFAGLEADPEAGRLLFVESLAGGRRMRVEREKALAEQEQLVRDFLESRPAGTDTLDIPVAAVEGARRYIVSRRLRAQSEDRLSSLKEDWLTWMSSYARPAEKSPWSTRTEALLPAPSAMRAHVSDESRPQRTRLPRGRHGLPPTVVARSQLTRIIAGTAEVMMTKGYSDVTVADIVAAAGVSRDVFYEHFSDKKAAFLEAQQFRTQEIVDICATAYFGEADWPRRVWSALDAWLGLMAEHPAIAHLRIVECYAVGAAAIRVTEEIMGAATIFLEEGFGYAGGAPKAPRLASEAITGAILELVHHDVARGRTAELPRRLPQLTYIALAPFVGADEAIRLVNDIRTANDSAPPTGSRQTLGGRR
ncbi:MAG TPA: TetR/AcrR family transcriptional regulator [Solirubrobacteraceae bacterium]|nr:TetR/AcrR family transcriptional regulator [Solirubrobacteraceae bacterium]